VHCGAARRAAARRGALASLAAAVVACLPLPAEPASREPSSYSMQCMSRPTNDDIYLLDRDCWLLSIVKPLPFAFTFTSFW